MSSTSGSGGDTGSPGEAGKGSKSGGGRNEPNQPRQPNDDQVVTGTETGALGQGERMGETGDVTQADRYKPEDNPERNPKPTTGNKEEQESEE